jgi:hypothetical protein
MVPYCGGTYRVQARVSKFIDEKTGKMKYLKTPAIILEDVWCGSCYSNKRMFCPRAIYSWWREAWLERVEVAQKIPHSTTFMAQSLRIYDFYIGIGIIILLPQVFSGRQIVRRLTCRSLLLLPFGAVGSN